MKILHKGAGKDLNREPPYRSKITAGHRSGQRRDSRTRRRREGKGKFKEKSQAGRIKGKRGNKDMVPAQIRTERRGKARTGRRHEKKLASTDPRTGN